MSAIKKERKEEIISTKKRKNKGLIDEDEDNDCEALIR